MCPLTRLVLLWPVPPDLQPPAWSSPSPPPVIGTERERGGARPPAVTRLEAVADVDLSSADDGVELT